MDTKFYQEMLSIRRKNEWSIRQMAKEVGMCYSTLSEFFDTSKQFRPLREYTMAKLNNRLGIAYEVMEEYNKEINKERGK